MSRLEVPDDIWLEIFDFIPPSQLITLQLVCHRFRALVAKPLLREVCWSECGQAYKDILKWKNRNANLTALPRSVTVTIPFQHHPTTDEVVAKERAVYDALYEQLPLFTSLQTLKLVGTTFCTGIYATLARIPSLRTLIISQCTYLPRPLSKLIDKAVNISGIPLRHFKLDHVSAPGGYYGAFHPIQLITAPTLDSLDITWTDVLAGEYERYIQGIQGHGIHGLGHALLHTNIQHGVLAMQPSPPPAASVPAPRLRYLEVRIPMLTHGLFRSLAHLTSPRSIPPSSATAHEAGRPALPVFRPPRLTLDVQYWSMDEQQLRELDRASQQDSLAEQRDVVKGLWSYTGPMEVLSLFMPLRMDHTVDMTARARADAGVDGVDTMDEDVAHDEENGYVLRHLRLTPPAAEPHLLVRLLWAVDTTFNPISGRRSKRLKGLFTLEVCLPRWDYEILFAIRGIFADIKTIIIRVGKEVGGEELLVTLGGSILPGLPNLHTLRIVRDPEAVTADQPRLNARTGYVSNLVLQYHLTRRPPSPRMSSDYLNLAPSNVSQADREEQAMLVQDYLYGWNRYCRALRTVQLSEGTEWVRRWEGCEWERMSNDMVGQSVDTKKGEALV